MTPRHRWLRIAHRRGQHGEDALPGHSRNFSSPTLLWFFVPNCQTSVQTDVAVKQESTREELWGIWRYGHLVKGVIAQFFLCWRSNRCGQLRHPTGAA